ncbi:MAG: dCMP deaminase family protein [Euryarchaeota archaeon]|nr:dCMP deaminase family protein [Euryarchaeota archaeon]
MARIDTDHYFMKIAELVKERSTCVKQKVGAVLVKDKHIISTGYNGAPRGVTHCTKETCLRLGLDSLEKSHLCRGAHAEENSIAQAAYHGVSTKNSVIYSTHFPCMSCSKLLINAGVRKIYYAREYDMDNELKMNILKGGGMEIHKVCI